MSRRKQSNPKPLLKSDCQETAEEMTVERDTKDLSTAELDEEADSLEMMDQSEPFSSDIPPEDARSSKSATSSDPDIIPNRRSPDNSNDRKLELNMTVPKLRLNAILASDPALKPDAKDIKILHEESIKIHEESLARDDNRNESPGIVCETEQVKTASSDVTHSRMKVFMCMPCGIGFSSPSTLEAHQAYYCSHRKDIEEEMPSSSSISLNDKNSVAEIAAKVIKTGKQYACTQCSYSADKKVSLNRHMRMHQTSPAPSSNASNGEDSSSQFGISTNSLQQIDRYCSECDIKFSNVKTYRAHKQHYCSSRRNDGPTTPKLDTVTTPTISSVVAAPKTNESVSPQATRSKTPSSVTPPQPFLALPTNPIIIIPYSLIRTASVIPGPLTSVSSSITNPDATCFSLENGSLKPIATTLNKISNQIPLVDATRSQLQTNNAEVVFAEKFSGINNTNNASKSIKKKDEIVRETAPLDLSLRKSPIKRHRSRSGSVLLGQDEKNEIERLREGKENFSIDSRSITPEQIVCAPSLPNSPSMSPSPKRRTLSPRGSSTASISPVSNNMIDLPLRSIFPTDIALKLSESNVIPPLLVKQNLELALKLSNAASAATTSIGKNSESSKTSLSSPVLNLSNATINTVPNTVSTSTPQIYVKQGVSKCKECNIVFCKYENYLAHKQHYCSARNQDDAEIKISTPPATVCSTETTPIAYQQLICAACGIKYTSLDNLRAHQKFYCPKGGGGGANVGGCNSTPGISNESSTHIQTSLVGCNQKCTKCKTVHDPVVPCASLPLANSTPINNLKCPVCDVVSLTATESRKHLETHGSVKAFRCSICRYKGNTLRGMRTHIRMHFDKKTSDFNEENYMSCILEDDGIEVQNNICINHEMTNTSLLQTSTTPRHHDQVASGQLYNCDICNYSSSYKGNVIRHVKLVHSQQLNSPSSSPEIGDENENISLNGDTQHKLDESFVIKSEPMDNNDTTALSPEQISHSCSNKKQNDTLLTHIKPEPIDRDRNDSESVLPVAASIAITTTSSTQIPPLNACTSPLSGDENSLKNSLHQKYCQTCDIKFNYMNTFLAHKQFYCKNTKRTERESPSPVPTVQSQTILNKNKENLEALL